MKKWVYKLALFAVLAAGLWALLWVGIYTYCLHRASSHKGIGPVWISHNVNPALQAQRLRQCHEPKIVILGGSNAGFGICSPIIHEHYHRPVFNTGNNGSVGLRMQLALFEDYLNPDDLVIVLPEYHQFGKDFWGSLILCHVLITDPDFVHSLSPFQALLLTPCWGDWVRLADDTQTPDFGSSLCYSSEALNTYGDIALPRPHKDFDPYGVAGFGSLNHYSFRYLASFLRRCPSRVILMPPAIDETSYQLLSHIIDTINQKLAHQGTPFAVPSSRYCWPDSLFYDTGYHLTAEAAERHTLMLLHDIDSILLASGVSI